MEDAVVGARIDVDEAEATIENIGEGVEVEMVEDTEGAEVEIDRGGEVEAWIAIGTETEVRNGVETVAEAWIGLGIGIGTTRNRLCIKGTRGLFGDSSFDSLISFMIFI